MTTLLETFNKANIQKLPDIKPGDTVRVHQKIKEGDKQRIQVFEGIVLAKKHGKGVNATITVRKVTKGVGVERIYPIHSTMIDKIEITKRSKVRRAKLYYLRDAKGRKARLKAKELGIEIIEEKPLEVEEEKIENKEEVSEEKEDKETPKAEESEKKETPKAEEKEVEKEPKKEEAPKE